MVSNHDRFGYIGGSGAKNMYARDLDNGKTFLQFWKEKKTGLRAKPFKGNIHTKAGTILEEEILKAAGVDEKYWNIKVWDESTMAGCNTDALDETVVYEAKTALPSVLKKFKEKKMTTIYLRQVMHMMYVTKRKIAKILVLPVEPHEKYNPFAVKVFPEKISVFTFTWDDFDMKEHDLRVKFFDYCFFNNIQPTNDFLKLFRLSYE